MNLFQPSDEKFPNQLPSDGEAIYYGPILPFSQAKDYLTLLLSEIPWEHDELTIFGRKIVTKRRTAWFGDEPFEYTYSNSTKTALPWTKALLELKQLAEKHAGESFNSCLLNLYDDGGQGMGWHSDDEDSIVPNSAIASISLGAERPFDLRHKESKEKIRILLATGSLLVMKGQCQQCWQHHLPMTKKVKTPRVNLTFRQMKVG